MAVEFLLSTSYYKHNVKPFPYQYQYQLLIKRLVKYFKYYFFKWWQALLRENMMVG